MVYQILPQTVSKIWKINVGSTPCMLKINISISCFFPIFTNQFGSKSILDLFRETPCLWNYSNLINKFFMELKIQNKSCKYSLPPNLMHRYCYCRRSAFLNLLQHYNVGDPILRIRIIFFFLQNRKWDMNHLLINNREGA